MAAARSVRRAYDRALAEVDLNLSEASVLAHIAHEGPLTQVELARRIGTNRSRVGAYIDSLQSKGAVVREATAEDRRVWLIALTPSGDDLWQRTVTIDGRVRQALRAGSTATDLDRADVVLGLLRANADSLLAE